MEPSQAFSGPSKPPGSNTDILSGAGALVAAALAAQAVTVALTKLVAPVPLLAAMLATLAFCCAWVGLSPSASVNTALLRTSVRGYLCAAAVTAAGVFVGIRLIAAVLGDAPSFYCNPAVPFRIEIAIFGSFAVGFCTRIAAARGQAQLIYPLILFAFFWIAPFYGFFQGPVFLATYVVTGCGDRGAISILLVASAMILTERLGKGLGGWMSTPQNDANTL